MPGHEEAILSACFTDRRSVIAKFNETARISAAVSLTFGTRDSDVLSWRSRWWARWRRHFLSGKDQINEQTEKSGRLRGCGEEEGGAMHNLYCFSRTSYLILLLRRKTPAALSRCNAGLQKFIKSALQAGYSSHKHSVWEKRSWCHIATNAQPVSLNLKMLIWIMESQELSTCRHSLQRRSKNTGRLKCSS